MTLYTRLFADFTAVGASLVLTVSFIHLTNAAMRRTYSAIPADILAEHPVLVPLIGTSKRALTLKFQFTYLTTNDCICRSIKLTAFNPFESETFIET